MLTINMNYTSLSVEVNFMRYLGTSGAVLAAAMTFSLTPLGQAARAFEDKPVVASMLGRNNILPLSAGTSGTITPSIERYTPTLLEALAEVNLFTCKEVTAGGWTHTPHQLCGKDASGNVLKCGGITRGTITGPLASGSCPGKTFTFAAIYYEWTAHNNQRITDTFDATWTGEPGYTDQYTFIIYVPVVRPDHETTAFERWSTATPTFGKWKQTLVPPSSDPSFDFSGESVQEADPGGGGPDTCWSDKSHFRPFTSITGGTWTVISGNVWAFDNVGWSPDAVTYYRNPTPPPTPPPPSPVPCGTTIPQQMTIKAPSDTSYNNYELTGWELG